ncbi:MAG: hypothetical protein LPK14_15370 [Hymenobacteraceae bacterium]|nr:hypothetical protein [Hymenobacteraceae bacterium]
MQLEKELKSYFKKSKRLEEQGGPTRNTELFEEILWSEQQLLAHFGLPNSDKYRKILWELTDKHSFQKKAVQQAIAKLQQAAEQHLLAPVHTAIEMLYLAQQERQNAFDVLPELGYVTHVYTLFLYEQLLLNGEASPEEILQELEKITELDCLSDLGTMSGKSSPRRTKVYRQLKDKLQFLEGFIDHILYDEEEEEEREEDSTDQPEPKPFLLEYPLRIERIICIDRTNISMIVQLQKPDGQEALTLGMQQEEFEELMSLYQPFGQKILSHTSRLADTNQFDELTYELDLEEDLGETLLIDKHYLEVYSPQIRDANGRLEENTFGFVMLSEIVPKDDQDTELRKASALQGITGYLKHIQAAYGSYQHKMKLLDKVSSEQLTQQEKELIARQHAGLQDKHLFEISRMLYELYGKYNTDFEVRGKKQT